MDVQKIDVTSIIDLQLGRRMAFNRQRQFVRPYPAAVINHQDSRQSASVRLDLDSARTGIDGVFHQLLDGTGRSLDHFAGGDAVDDLTRQTADGHESYHNDFARNAQRHGRAEINIEMAAT